MVYNHTFNFFKVAFMTLIVFAGVLVTSNKSISTDMAPEFTKMKLNAAIDVKQLQCMAKNIFYEAGSESIHGQAAVARVVLNRVSHGFSKTVCGVVYQSTTVDDNKVCQFSWVCQNKPEPKNNDYRYVVAKQVAYDVMVNNKYHDVVPKSALFFHNISVEPLWPHKQLAKIGNHIFYERAKKKPVTPKKKVFESQ